jgi:hypothetical protein
MKLKTIFLELKAVVLPPALMRAIRKLGGSYADIRSMTDARRTELPATEEGIALAEKLIDAVGLFYGAVRLSADTDYYASHNYIEIGLQSSAELRPHIKTFKVDLKAKLDEMKRRRDAKEAGEQLDKQRRAECTRLERDARPLLDKLGNYAGLRWNTSVSFAEGSAVGKLTLQFRGEVEPEKAQDIIKALAGKVIS